MLPILAALALALPAAGDGPFADLDLDAALAKAKAEEKLVVIDFTADWCPPCKKMEKDTWANADVRAWLAANAIALQIDVDAEPKLAQRFSVQSLPTVVALRGGEEFDRFIGYRDAQRFLQWGRAVRAGKSSVDALKERAAALRDSGDVQVRYELAGELLRAGELDEALYHYLWLWPATRTEARFGGVRTSFMLREIAELAKRHAPAREAFGKVFDELQQRVTTGERPEFQDWQEWTAFCRYFGEEKRVLAWYEARRDAEGRLFPAADDFMAGLIVDDVFDALMAAERWQDATRLYADARGRAEKLVKRYQRMVEGAEDMAPETREGVVDHARGSLLEDMGRLYGAMLLADRKDEAAAVAELLLAALDIPEARLALVRQGTGLTGRVEPIFTRWLDEAEAAGGNVASLRRRLEKLERREGQAESGG